MCSLLSSCFAVHSHYLDEHGDGRIVSQAPWRCSVHAEHQIVHFIMCCANTDERLLWARGCVYASDGQIVLWRISSTGCSSPLLLYGGQGWTGHVNLPGSPLGMVLQW